MPHFTILQRGGKGMPWRPTERSSPDRDRIRIWRLGYLNGGLSPECLKILETADGEEATIAAAVAELNRPTGKTQSS